MRILLSTILFLSLLACQNNSVSSNDNSHLRSPQSETAETKSGKSIELIRPKESFTINTSKNVVLETKKSSRIHIPKGAFEHKDGSDANKIRIEFSEYQTQGEILASGLPMVYSDPSGKKMHFESAGMFEIRAYDGKEEVRLKKGKEVKVELATPSDGLYNFYNLDDNAGVWKEEAENLRPIANPYLDELKKEEQSLDSVKADKPKKTVAYVPGDKLFDIKADPNEYPEFKEIPGAMWKYMGDNPKEDPALNAKYFSKTYSFVELVPTKGDEYIFAISFASKKDTVKILMAPVFTGKLKEKNEKRFKERLSKFAAVTKEKERIRNQARRESELLRVFNLDKMGIYNYDRQWKDEQAIPVLANFTFGTTPHSDAKEINVYLVPERKLVVIKYTYDSAKDFRINLNERNRLIAVDGDGTVYALSSKEIATYDLAQYKSHEVTFQLKRLDQKAKSSSEVDAILASL